ncbi:jg3571 [Pararge aegeria aegeria]|uniref:Jg3571 protein n=1 Tax=Pararge aegeria aegeria TaxID=348720 RepID=A0A8S4RLB0_9NEOP|nr:jg3571 [Pararge aegeria aegeria]
MNFVRLVRAFSGVEYLNTTVVFKYSTPEKADCSEISLPIIDLPAHDDSGEIPCSQFSQRTAHNNSPSILDQSLPNMPEVISFEQPDQQSLQTENQLEVENHKKTRNKRSAPKTWKQNVRKCLRQSGKEYVSLRGKKVGARKVRPKDCSSCRRKCNQSFDECAREMIHNAYWNLKDSDKQKQYVSTLVDEVQTKVKTAGENSRRKMTREFFFYKDGGKVQVCQEFFLKTLDISEGFLRNVLKKRDAARVVAPSNRGKHQPGVTRPIENKEIIEKHILSFPTVPSHYCRKKTNHKYLPEDLSLRDMYNLYMKQCTEQNIVSEKFWLYRQIFNNQHLKFHKPRKDMCDSCVKYKNCSEEEKPGLFPLHMQHIRRKTEARQYHDDNKNLALNKVLNFIEIDLEAVRYCPKVSAKAIFLQTPTCDI